MANYRFRVTPTTYINPTTEGSMDTSLNGGFSIQRTGYIEVYNNGDRKIVVVNDNEAFNDTMQNFDSANDFVEED